MATVNLIEDVITGEPEAKKQKLDEQTEVSVVDPTNDESESKLTNLEQEIIEQVEYYFSDSNLFRDKFLQTEIAKNDGWIQITTLTTFKRLAAHSTDVKVIVDALDKSDSGLLEISEDRQSIRRHPERPLPEKNEETRQEIISRSAYVKGFPQDLEMPELIEYFKEYPKVAHITIRKYLDKPTKTYKPKGSVFVTFVTREQCAEFLSQDIKYKDTELISKWQSDYYADKKTERNELKKAKSEPELELPKGTVLIITDIKSDNTRDKIREKMESFEIDVAFVEYTNGEERAFVRFGVENGAKDVLAKLEDGKLKFGDDEVTVRLVEGEEEDKYLKECADKMKMRRNNKNKNTKGNFKHNKFGNRKRPTRD